MIHYLILCALLAITLVGLVAVFATGLMLVAIRADQEWEQRNWLFILRLVRYYGASPRQQLTVKREIRRCERERKELER